jgi:uncharacterized protein YndB with AHSA1/START domain
VWKAISDAKQFGSWFGVSFDGSFAPGARLVGTIVPTTADPEVAKMQEPYRGKKGEFFIEQIEPMRRVSFRWHPYAIDENVDYSNEPTTLVELVIAEAPGGTLLTITESGFDRIPLERRAKAFSMNETGWEGQLALIAKHLS